MHRGDASGSARPFATKAAGLLVERHCENVLYLDVRGLSQVCDWIVIGSGTSDRQMRSTAEDLKHLGAEHGHRVFRTSSDIGATWIVIDCVDVVVHLFEPALRGWYDLEDLWSEAPRIECATPDRFDD